MATPSEIERNVTAYLNGLGFDDSLIKTEVLTSQGERADFVVYTDDRKPLAVIEVKAGGKNYPRAQDISLKFHPYVRQAQLIADELKASYYSLSDGTSFFWFTTDHSGWPQLLLSPIAPERVVDRTKAQRSKSELVRALQDLQQFVFWRGGRARQEETAIVILAKLMIEMGEPDLLEVVAQSGWKQTPLPLFPEVGISNLLIDLAEPRKSGRNLREALDLIRPINLTSLDPKIVLAAFDQTVLPSRESGQGPWRINRWLADFMVQLARPKDHQSLLDISASHGDILAASRLSYPSTEVYGIIQHPLSALWAKIQQLVLGNTQESIFQGELVPREFMDSRRLRVPSLIITAPSFGAKLQQGQGESDLLGMGVNQVEDLILELALDWVGSQGRVVILVPDGLLFSGGKRLLTRQMLINRSHVVGVISLASGLLASASLLKSSLLILDKEKPNNPQTFLGVVDNFDADDTFASREIEKVNGILEKFWRFEDGLYEESDNDSRIVNTDQLDVTDLTAARYFHENISRERVSRFPVLSLQSISKSILRGKSLRLREYGDAPILGPAAIRSMELDKAAIKMANRIEIPANAPTAESGDVLLNLIGTHLGEAALVTAEISGAFISGHVALVRPDTTLISPQYLAIALNSNHAREQIARLFTGALIKGLPLYRLKKITVPVPPLDTQKRIVEAVQRAKTELEEAKAHTKSVENKYARLIETVTTSGVIE